MYKKYCCGCGLCEATGKCKLNKNQDGFAMPTCINDDAINFFKKVCPSSGKQSSVYDKNNIWGRYKKVFISYANNKKIRHCASSGGTITSLCQYLLENKIIDGIIHIGMDENNPISTKVYCSKTVKELVERSGSRYSDSSPLKDIIKYLETENKYAFVGRPCDIDALLNYSKTDNRVEEKILYTISFFCAGVPSDRANNNLLTKIGIKKEECVSLQYRGNGWPGYTTAIDNNNNEYKMTYEEAWGKILGRDIRPICRLCMNGIGESADIACGDAWYLDDKNNPIFEENEGRNITFCRTRAGEALFNNAVKKGYIVAENYDNWENEIKYYQKYQYERRSTLLYTIKAMHLCLKKTPKYDKKILLKYSKNASKKIKLKRFIGTIKRIIKGRIK